MERTFTIAFWVLIPVTGLLAAYAGQMQVITLWAGKKIADPELTKEMPTGFQDAITPKGQTRLQITYMILAFMIVVLGFIKNWYLGILGFVLFLLAWSIIKRLLPKYVDHYLLRIIGALENRMADYYKNNDHVRGEAAKNTSEKLKLLYVVVRGKKIPVPDIEDVKKSPLGK